MEASVGMVLIGSSSDQRPSGEVPEQPDCPPTREYFEKRLQEALMGADEIEYRMNLGIQC